MIMFTTFTLNIKNFLINIQETSLLLSTVMWSVALVERQSALILRKLTMRTLYFQKEKVHLETDEFQI